MISGLQIKTQDRRQSLISIISSGVPSMTLLAQFTINGEKFAQKYFEKYKEIGVAVWRILMKIPKQVHANLFTVRVTTNLFMIDFFWS